MYFGTNGVRGLFNKLDPILACKLAQAFGLYSDSKTILVARDHRKTSKCLSLSVISGLLSVGCKVIDLGFCSSPTAELMLKEKKAQGLIIVTASHNPPEWNALKFVNSKGIAVSKEEGILIENYLDKISVCDFEKIKPLKKQKNSSKIHMEKMLDFFAKEKIKQKEYRVLLDLANGTANLVAPHFFKELGCTIDTINSDIDPLFNGRPSEPTKENLKGLEKAVVNGKYDLAIAYDGDSDRVVMFDKFGNFINGDLVFALNLKLCLNYYENENYFKKIVTTVATSKIIEDLAKEKNYQVIYTKIGAPYISKAMLEENARIGGEEVGGIIWPEISLAKDGFFASTKVLELMALENKSLDILVKELGTYFMIKTKVNCKDNFQKKEMIENIRKYALKNNLKINEIDGIRILDDDGWSIVRPSGTENCIRIFSEYKNLKKTEEENKKLIKIAKNEENFCI